MNEDPQKEILIDDDYYDDDYYDDDYCWDNYEDDDDEADWYNYDFDQSQGTQILTRIYSRGLLVSELIQQTRIKPYYYCLATSYMLIADIDCGDNIDKPLKILADYATKNRDSFKVYKTKNGMRYLQTNVLYQGCNNQAISTLKDLGTDPKYIEWCKQGLKFMARVAPKNSDSEKYFNNRIQGIDENVAICHFLDYVGTDKIISTLSESVDTHDFLTQAYDKNKPLL